VAKQNELISIVAPVYNEESVLDALYQRVQTVLDGAGETWELVLVNDGSRDRSAEVIASLHAADPRVKGLSFSRNFGFQIAATAGLDYARGETWFKVTTAKLFYRLIHRITSINIPLDTGDFRLMDRRVINSLRGMNERNRFLRGMVPWVGFRQIGVEYHREARYAGEAKFTSVKKMLPFALDAITSFSYFPLQLATILGFVMAAISAIAILAVVLVRLLGPHEPLLGQATTLVAVLFLGSVQLISLGIIGEYLGRIYDEVKGRPLYLIQQSWGIDDAPLGRFAPPMGGSSVAE